MEPRRNLPRIERASEFVASRGLPPSPLEALLEAIRPELESWDNLDIGAAQRDAMNLILAHTAETFGAADKAERWLKRSSPVLGRSPLEELTLDPKLVEDELTRIDHGIHV